MAALLVAMSILAVMMTVALPVWKQNTQREKEEELVFRGKQYVHAIALFQRKYPGTYPPNLNVLFEQKFLRKKYKDPITDDDFVPIPFGQAVPGPPAAPGGQSSGRSGQPSTQPTSAPSMSSRGSTPTSTIAANTGRGGSTFN
ncbi:MAG TPA: type II secretion system protein, partial [Vicinamibacterales bacterium]|nr:type II secretion system protein [Vicinamibacterales bacterium]